MQILHLNYLPSFRCMVETMCSSFAIPDIIAATLFGHTNTHDYIEHIIQSHEAASSAIQWAHKPSIWNRQPVGFLWCKRDGERQTNGKKPHNYLAKQGWTQHKNKSEEEKLQSQRHKCRVNNAGLEIYVAVWCDSKKRSLIANTQLHTLSQYIHTLSTIYNIVVIITIILYFAYRLLYTCTESATVHTIQD